jgi:polysaccharide export outer membrane protein
MSEKEYLANIPRVADEENAKVFTTDFTVPDEYVITQGDLLIINIYKRSDFSPLLTLTDYTVDSFGNIFIPPIGDIQAEGITTRQLRSKIKNHLTALYVSPIVNVALKEATGMRIYVLGQVKKPGSYGLSINEKATVIDSIAVAGGFSKIADRSKVIILRTVPAKKGYLKSNHLAALDIEKLLTEADIRQNVILRKGDIVYVPPDYISQSDRFYKNISNKLAPFVNVVSAVAQVAILFYVQ